MRLTVRSHWHLNDRVRIDLDLNFVAAGRKLVAWSSGWTRFRGASPGRCCVGGLVDFENARAAGERSARTHQPGTAVRAGTGDGLPKPACLW